MPVTTPSPGRSRIVLLGTAGGLLTYPMGPAGRRTARHGTSTLVDIGGALYVVDFGIGATHQLTLALDPAVGPGQVLRGLAAGFVTHLHSDHVVDLPTVGLAGYHQGWPDDQVKIVGPGPRHVDEPMPGGAVEVGGTRALIAALSDAFLADQVERTAGGAAAPLVDRWIGVDVPAAAGAGPVAVYEDSRVRVTAVEVDHGGMRPALAYRFDADEFSLVVSGDTCPCRSLVDLAAGADILVHEAIDPSIADILFGPGPHTQPQREKAARVMAKHTRADQVGTVAEAAGVKTLALTHLVPGSAPDSAWEVARRGFSGRLFVGHDLQEVPLP